MSPREVDVSMAGWALRGSSSSGTQTDAMADVMLDAMFGDSTQQVLIQQGQTLGSIVAFECPTVRSGVPAMDRGSEEITVEFAGPAEGTTAGEDEVFLLFG